jgi:hypothetical protein
MEVILVILGVFAVMWVLWGSAMEDSDPMMIARKQRIESNIEMRSRRYTNVVKKKQVRTVRHTVAGIGSGTGNGGATLKKS